MTELLHQGSSRCVSCVNCGHGLLARKKKKEEGGGEPRNNVTKCFFFFPSLLLLHEGIRRCCSQGCLLCTFVACKAGGYDLQPANGKRQSPCDVESL